MTMRHRSSAIGAPRTGGPPTSSEVVGPAAFATARRLLQRCLLTGLLGAAAALLVSCASSTSGLIPASDAGPLQLDFEEVERAARSGNGTCNTTEAAIAKAVRDFEALPATLDHGLRARLRQGIAALRSDALKLCAEPLPSATTGATPHTTPPTTSTATTPPATTSTGTTPTTSTPSPSGAPGGAEGPSGESGAGAGAEVGGAGEADREANAEGKEGKHKGGDGADGANGSGGQESGK